MKEASAAAAAALVVASLLEWDVIDLARHAAAANDFRLSDSYKILIYYSLLHSAATEWLITLE